MHGLDALLTFNTPSENAPCLRKPNQQLTQFFQWLRTHLPEDPRETEKGLWYKPGSGRSDKKIRELIKHRGSEEEEASRKVGAQSLSVSCDDIDQVTAGLCDLSVCERTSKDIVSTAVENGTKPLIQTRKEVALATPKLQDGCSGFVVHLPQLSPNRRNRRQHQRKAVVAHSSHRLYIEFPPIAKVVDEVEELVLAVHSAG